MSYVITAALLNTMCQSGMTTKEMAEKITNQSGIKCSVNQVKKACEYYGISLKAKPRKSAFAFEEVVTTNNNNNTEVEENSSVGNVELV